MKIVQTIITDTHVEITFADDANLEKATATMVARLPKQTDKDLRCDRLATIQAEALRRLRDAITAEIDAL